MVVRTDDPEAIKVLADDIIRNHAPSMKLATDKYLVSLKASVPYYRDNIPPAENRMAFEQDVAKAAPRLAV